MKSVLATAALCAAVILSACQNQQRAASIAGIPDDKPDESLTWQDVLAQYDEPGATVPGPTSVTLRQGFQPNPQLVQIYPGGDSEGSRLGVASCPGFFDSTTPYTLNYQAGVDHPLVIGAVSNEDLVIIVEEPSGRRICNDDQVGLNPVVAILSPSVGTYRIWVGTYYPNRGTPNAMLVIATDTDVRNPTARFAGFAG